MIRLAWRQFRTSAAVIAVILVALAVLTVTTRPHPGDFTPAVNTLRTWLGILTLAMPGITGVFLGAPLVARELESGTFRLAWTQSVTRTRWLAVKLGVVGLASLAAAGLTSLAVTWWASSLDRAQGLPYATFDSRDILPIGYAAFAFALGVFLGVVIRRSLPAMAATFAVIVGALLADTLWLRAHLLAPLRLTRRLGLGGVGFGSFNGGPFTLVPNVPPGAGVGRAWILFVGLDNRRTGAALTTSHVNRICPTLSRFGPGGGGHPRGDHGSRIGTVGPPAGLQHALIDCITKLSGSYHEIVSYQPTSHYWLLQWTDFGTFLALAVVLGVASVWWVRRLLQH